MVSSLLGSDEQYHNVCSLPYWVRATNDLCIMVAINVEKVVRVVFNKLLRNDLCLLYLLSSYLRVDSKVSLFSYWVVWQWRVVV